MDGVMVVRDDERGWRNEAGRWFQSTMQKILALDISHSVAAISHTLIVWQPQRQVRQCCAGLSSDLASAALWPEALTASVPRPVRPLERIRPAPTASVQQVRALRWRLLIAVAAEVRRKARRGRRRRRRTEDDVSSCTCSWCAASRTRSTPNSRRTWLVARSKSVDLSSEPPENAFRLVSHSLSAVKISHRQQRPLRGRSLGLLTPTTVLGVKRSPASVCASVCLSVCTQNKTKTAETTITKLATGRNSPSQVLATHLILGQKVKVSGSQSAKTYCRRSSGGRELCTVSSTQPL